VDNGRSTLLASPLHEALYCIRCGACLNACPVFRELSGHAYLGADGSIAPYPGPIGSVISPGLFGCENYGHLAQASSLCGACKEACPVDIDLPGLLLRVRSGLSPQSPKNGDERAQRKTKEGVGIPFTVKFGLKGFRLAAGSASLFAVFQSLGGLLSRVYSPRRAYMRLPTWTGWGYSKDFPRLTTRMFRSRWKNIKQEIEEEYQVIRQPGEAPTPEAPPPHSLITQFTDELTALGGKVYLVAEKELPARLAGFLKSKGIERACVDAVRTRYIVSLPTDITIAHEPDAMVQAGITGALYGIAETGSLLLVSGTGQTLTASLLPEVHVAVLKTSRLVPTVADALRRPEVRNAAAGVIITGPSRTGDIEMTHTIGVHGPGELHVFLIDDSMTV
jgi:L-lactate utilization protein LutB